jgi:hypothetical protein
MAEYSEADGAVVSAFASGATAAEATAGVQLTLQLEQEFRAEGVQSEEFPLGFSDGRMRALLNRAMALIRAGAQPGVRNGLTFWMANHLSAHSIVNELLEFPEAADAQNLNDALSNAYRNGWWDTVATLIRLPPERGVDLSNGDLLQEACKDGQAEVVRLLLEAPPERGVEPGAGDNVPIVLAADGGHLEVVRLLLELPRERGVRPSARQNQALFCAVANENPEMVALLAAGEDLRVMANDREGNILSEAAFRGNATIVDMLVNRYMTASYPRMNDCRAVLLAATFRHVQALEALLRPTLVPLPAATDEGRSQPGGGTFMRLSQRQIASVLARIPGGPAPKVAALLDRAARAAAEM